MTCQVTTILKLKLSDRQFKKNFILFQVTIDFNTIHGIREDKFHAKLPIFIQRFKRLHEGFLNLIEGDKELLAEAVTSFKSADVNGKLHLYQYCNHCEFYTVFCFLPVCLDKLFKYLTV